VTGYSLDFVVLVIQTPSSGSLLVLGKDINDDRHLFYFRYVSCSSPRQ